MYRLQNNSWQASTLLRALLTIVFIVWLASVMTQYNKKITTQKPQISIKQPPSNVVIEQLPLPAVPTPKLVTKPKTPTKSQTPALSKIAKQTSEPANKMEEKAPQTSSVNKQHIEKVYQTLSNEGVDIQIAWPQDVNKRQAALNFMYQCVGVQFAVLNGNTLTKINHTKTNHTKIDHNKPNQSKLIDYSEWIRVAQGSLSKKEQNWLNAYAIKGTPIRLFPRQLDWRLAEYLANVLKGTPLASLRANYQVTNYSLKLTHIYINNKKITNSWILYQGKC
jgi:hypothetical protein